MGFKNLDAALKALDAPRRAPAPAAPATWLDVTCVDLLHIMRGYELHLASLEGENAAWLLKGYRLFESIVLYCNATGQPVDSAALRGCCTLEWLEEQYIRIRTQFRHEVPAAVRPLQNVLESFPGYSIPRLMKKHGLAEDGAPLQRGQDGSIERGGRAMEEAMAREQFYYRAYYAFQFLDAMEAIERRPAASAIPRPTPSAAKTLLSLLELAPGTGGNAREELARLLVEWVDELRLAPVDMTARSDHVFTTSGSGGDLSQRRGAEVH